MQRRRKPKGQWTKKEGTATLYEELDTREGEVKINRIVKARQREREGTGNINIVKNMEGKVVFKQKEVGKVWAEYFWGTPECGE